METAQLYHGLTFLAYATGVIVIIVGCMLFKLLFDLSKLAKNVNQTTEIVNTELGPTLKNINKSVEILSGIVIKTDESITKIKEMLSKSPLGIIGKITSATGTVAKGIFSGLVAAFKMFGKSK